MDLIVCACLILVVDCFFFSNLSPKWWPTNACNGPNLALPAKCVAPLGAPPTQTDRPCPGRICCPWPDANGPNRTTSDTKMGQPGEDALMTLNQDAQRTRGCFPDGAPACLPFHSPEAIYLSSRFSFPFISSIFSEGSTILPTCLICLGVGRSRL
jgi:hypothetical protein